MERRRDDFEVIREVLARERRLGEPFEVAWPIALRVLDGPRATTAAQRDRDRTDSALHATKIDWRLAYEGRPPRPLAA